MKIGSKRKIENDHAYKLNRNVSRTNDQSTNIRYHTIWDLQGDVSYYSDNYYGGTLVVNKVGSPESLCRAP